MPATVFGIVQQSGGSIGVDARPVKNLTTSVWASMQDDYYLTTANAGDQFGDFFLVNLDLAYRHRRLTFGAHVIML